MKKTVTSGVLIALALIFSYIESLIPIPVPMPGIKLGLANLVVLFAIYRLGSMEAIAISLIRVILAGFLFSNLSATIYGLAGAMLALITMWLLHRLTRLHIITISICGAIGHIIGQLIVAGAVTNYGAVAYYMPYLLLSAVITGAVIGVVAGILVDRVPV